jgi:hypothetical protein
MEKEGTKSQLIKQCPILHVNGSKRHSHLNQIEITGSHISTIGNNKTLYFNQKETKRSRVPCIPIET